MTSVRFEHETSWSTEDLNTFFCSLYCLFTLLPQQVQTVSSNNIQVKIPAQCGRPVRTLSTLFTQNYAPTFRNGILLQNCTSPVTGCVIPSTTVQTNFDLLDCNVTGTNKTNNITCYSQQNQQTGFIDYSNLTSRGCEYLFSAISTSSTGNGSGVVLAIQVVELGWWLDGGCLCSENAACAMVEFPGHGGNGYRCRCYDGFVGDGYLDGLGCWRGKLIAWIKRCLWLRLFLRSQHDQNFLRFRVCWKY